MSEKGRSVRLRVADMRKSIHQIRDIVGKTDFETFKRNFVLHNSVIRDFEVLGEACKHLPADLTDRFPAIPWQDIRDMRNLLSHEYFGVDLVIVWETATGKLDELERALEIMAGD